MTYLNKPIIAIVIRGDVNAALYFSTSDSLFLFAVYKCTRITRIRVQVEPKCFEFQFRTHSNFELCMHRKFDRFKWLNTQKYNTVRSIHHKIWRRDHQYITRNSLKAVFVKPSFFMRVFIAKNEGTKRFCSI